MVFWLETWGKAANIPIMGAPLNGWVFLVIGFLSVAMGWPFGKVSWLMWAWMMDLALVFWSAGLGFLGFGPAWVWFGGLLLLFFNIICLYIAIAGHINTAFGGPKLPLGSPIFK